MQATPSTWMLLLDAGWRSVEPSKFFAVERPYLVSWPSSYWRVAIRFGISMVRSETTMWSTIATVRTDGGPVHIGRPIANTQIYILDSHLQPVPIGVQVNSISVVTVCARGYLNRPELTAERFVANPFKPTVMRDSTERETELVTGRMETSNFSVVVDNQVKIRGYRIELGEIEAALNQAPDRERLRSRGCQTKDRLRGKQKPESEGRK